MGNSQMLFQALRTFVVWLHCAATFCLAPLEQMIVHLIPAFILVPPSFLTNISSSGPSLT